MPSKPMVAAKGWVTCRATTSAPTDRAKQIPALAACAESGEPSVGIRIFLNMLPAPVCLVRKPMLPENPCEPHCGLPAAIESHQGICCDATNRLVHRVPVRQYASTGPGKV